MRMRLQNKFALILLPVVVLPILVATFFIYQFIHNKLSENVHQNTNAHLHSAISRIESNATKSISQFEFIANQPVIHEYLKSSGEERSVVYQSRLIGFFDEMSNKNGFEEIFIFDADGKLSYTHSSEIFYDHREDSKWYGYLINQLGEKPYATIQSTSRGSRFVYTIKINDKKGSPVGYLIGTENMSFLSGWMHLSSESDIAGAFLIHDKKVIQKSGDFNTVDILNAVKSNDSGNQHQFTNYFSLADERNEIKQLIYTASGPFDLIIGVVVSYAAFAQLQDYLITGSIFGSLAIMLMLIALIYFSFNRLIIGKLDVIKNATQQIAEGTHDIELPENMNDQLGEVMHNFNIMTRNMKKSYEKIHDLAFYDELTGLNNKSSFKMQLSRLALECTDEKSEIALLSIDLDDFKSINDLHGHHTGDIFLKVIATRIMSTVAASIKDHVNKYSADVYRLAGDEFAVLIYGKNIRTYSEKISKRIVSAIAEVTTFESIELYPSGTIGISIFPTQARNEEELYKFSDIAMYEAKSSGKNTYMMFEPQMIERVVHKEELCKEIKLAIEHDAFELYMQPKYDIKKREFNKFESLIRWMHPKKGFISPGIFIPIAEESNLIVEIGNWVMKQTCKNIRELESLGWKNFRVSFNVSPQQLYDRNFSRNLKSCIKMFGINPNHLEIEVTEHSFAKNDDFVISELKTAREMGVTVALDDFGTGYSSLAYIQKLPLDVIKLDRSFVSKAKTCYVNLTIIKAVLNIAEALKLDTVAEGVETKEELELMESLGADYIQGYYFYAPMPMRNILSTDFKVEKKFETKLVAV